MKTRIASAALLGGALATPAIAQEIVAEAPRAEDLIVVTASRSGEGTQTDQIGGSATLVGADLVERRQARAVADLLRDVPGIAVSRVPGATQVRLRGAEANHTLVLVDGIEVSDPFTGEFDFGTLAADLGARLEVLRGPQSALYGSDAIGGVIHYLTPRGHDAPGLAMRAEAGSFGTVNAAARVGGVAGGLDYSVAATWLATDGVPNARGGTRDLADDSGALSATLTWSPSSTVMLTAVGRYARTSADFNSSDADPASPSFGLIVDSSGSRFENEALYGLVRGETELLDGRWTHAIVGQIADTNRDGFDAAGPAYGSEGQRLKGSYETALRVVTGALRHRFTFALDLERERFRNKDPSGFAFGGRRSTDNLGLVGDYELFVGERAVLGAAVRRDENDRFRDATTYRVQGSYRTGAGTRLRAAAGSGIKNPGFYELFGFIDGRYTGNPNLRPERSVGWEIGAEQSIAGDRVLLGATYFDSRLEDEIFTTFAPPLFVASPANRDTRSTQKGVEAYLRASLGSAWRVDASYTFTRAREDGSEEVRRPRHLASAALDWRLPGQRGGLTLVARYNGRTPDLAFTDPSFVPVRVRLDDFLLLNLNGDLALTDRLAVFARVENLLDEDYEEVFSFTAPGRAAYAGLRVRL